MFKDWDDLVMEALKKKKSESPQDSPQDRQNPRFGPHIAKRQYASIWAPDRRYGDVSFITNTTDNYFLHTIPNRIYRNAIIWRTHRGSDNIRFDPQSQK